MPGIGLRSALFLPLVGALLLSAAAAAATPGKILWQDNFNGDGTSKPNPSLWNHDTGDNGWGNQELQDYTDSLSNVKVTGGNLVITARVDNSKATSGRVQTQDKVTFKYGVLEARIKMPPEMAGLWPAFWTLGNNFPTVGWPFCGELDVMEMGYKGAIANGNEKRWVGSAAHFEVGGSRSMRFDHLVASQDLTDSWHVYKMDWTSTHVTTYVDDVPFFYFPLNAATCGDCAEFHQHHYIIANIAMGGMFPGVDSVSGILATTPAEMLIDYIRITSNADSAPIGGSSVNGGVVTDCGCGSICTNTGVLDAKYKGSTIRDLINEEIPKTGSEQKACRDVANTLPGLFGGTDCDPNVCKPPGFHTKVTCGCDSCTEDVLNRVASDQNGDYTCGSRIRYLMMDLGKPELEACELIANDFPTICGFGCAPGICTGTPDFTTSGNTANGGGSTQQQNMGTWVDGYNAGFDKAYSDGKTSPIDDPGAIVPPNTSSQEYKNGYVQGYTAGFSVGFAAKGSANDAPEKIDCGCPSTCSSDVLDLPMSDQAGMFSCQARIKWVIENKKRGEEQACLDIASEFPECGNGCTPGSCAIQPKAIAAEDITCGCADSCNAGVLDQPAPFNGDTYTCRARIHHLLTTDKSLSEASACQQVADEIPSVCGQGCDPSASCSATSTSAAKTAISADQITCGCADSCNAGVLDLPAPYNGADYTCRARIHYLITQGVSEDDACLQVATEIPDICGQGCDPAAGCIVAAQATSSSTASSSSTSSGAITCGCPKTCTDKVLSQVVVDAGGAHSCEARIQWTMDEYNLPEILACEDIATEFGTTCGWGCNPKDPCV